MITKPDSSQLEHWRRQPETMWIMQNLKQQFRALKPHQSAPSWEQHHRLVGNQEVIHSIEKLSGAISENER